MPKFWKQVLTVLTGTVAAQALPLLAAPLITRLCSPADMGAFSVWLGMVAVAAIAASLRMETAMILDHGEREQRICFGAVAYSASALALLLTVAGLIAWALPLARKLNTLSLLTIGLATWLTSYTQTTLAYATSHSAFGQAAHAKVWGAGGVALAQLILLASGAGSCALVLGQLLGLTTGLVAAQAILRPPRARIGWRADATLLAYWRKHQAFWRFSLPSNLLNAMVGQLPLFLIGMRYGALAAGLYTLTQRVLAAPISLLAASVLEVFKRQCVHDFETIGNCRDAYLHALKVLVSLGLAPALLLYLYAPALFTLVFGTAWRTAGVMAQVLAPLFFLNFVASPLSYVFFVAGKQKIELAWQCTLFVVTVSSFSLPATLDTCLALYTFGYSLLYLVYLCMSYRYACNGMLRSLAHGARPIP